MLTKSRSYNAKRPRLTTEDILASLSSDDDDRYSDDGDFDEPMMPGSDYEFSDCDDIDSDDESAPHSPIPHSPTGTSLTVSNSIFGSPMSSSDAGWSSTLTPVNIAQFNSPVGPIVTVPDSPLKVFELLFTTDLQSNVVNENNKYAAQVMGEERYNKWDKMTEDEFRAYLGFNKLPSIDDYWSRNPLLLWPIALQEIASGTCRGIYTSLTTQPSQTEEVLTTTGWVKFVQ